MASELNDTEIVLNKYLQTLERDLKELKKNKKDESIKRRIKNNIDVFPDELEYFAFSIDSAPQKDKESFLLTLERFKAKFQEIKSKFEDQIGQKDKKFVSSGVATTPEGILDEIRRINLCDMNRFLNRKTDN
jgi:hypothetical protein